MPGSCETAPLPCFPRPGNHIQHHHHPAGGGSEDLLTGRGHGREFRPCTLAKPAGVQWAAATAPWSVASPAGVKRQ
jgi:hypothetical protein